MQLRYCFNAANKGLRITSENSTNETPTLGSSRILAPGIELVKLTLTPVDVKVLTHVEVVVVHTEFLVSIVVSIPAVTRETGVQFPDRVA